MKSESGLELLREVMATADAFVRESARLFRPHGVTAAQFNVLNVVGAAPDGLSQRELGDVLVVDRSNVTGLIDRMEKAGWVARRAHPTDRRAHHLVLTAEGRRVWRRLQPLYAEAVAQVTGELTERQLSQTLTVLKTLQTRAARWPSPTA